MIRKGEELFSWSDWGQVPLLFPAIFFLLGTVLPISIEDISPAIPLVLGSLCGGMALWCYGKEYPASFFLLYLLGIFYLGTFFLLQRQEIRLTEQKQILPYILEGIVPEWVAGLERDPEEGLGYYTLLLRLESVEHTATRQKLNSRCRLVVYCNDGCDLAQSLETGDRIRFRTALHIPQNFSNPGMFDYRGYLERQDILLIGALKSPLLMERIAGKSGQALWRYSSSARRSFTDYLRSTFSRYGPDGSRTSAILEGLLFGRRERMDLKVEDLFQKTGTYHIFVVSGFNTTLIAIFLVAILRFFSCPRPATIPIIALALFSYAVMADMNIPVLRATILSLFVLIAHTLWRKVHLLNSLALTAIVILALWPESARDTSFQLTYGACLAIVCIAVPLTQRWLRPLQLAVTGLFIPNTNILQNQRIHRWARRLRFELEWMVEEWTNFLGVWREKTTKVSVKIIFLLGSGIYYLAGILLVSVSIQLFLAPMMADLFHRATLASAMANVLVVPVMTLLLLSSLTMGILFMLLQWTWEPWAQTVIWACQGTLNILQWLSNWKYWHWWVPAPPAGWIWLYYGLWILALLPFRATMRRLLLAAALLVLPTFFWSPFPLKHEQGSMEVWFFDVGHGDSILLIFPNGRTMLVDGGGQWRPSVGEDPEKNPRIPRFDIGKDVVCPALWALRVRRLDYVLLSHPERDHAGGLEAVLDHFPVGELLGPAPVEKWKNLVPELTNMAQTKGLVWRGMLKGETFSIDGVELRVLNPPASLLGAHSRMNNRSVVLHIRYAGKKLLLTGDLESRAEFDLTRECDQLQADLLKVAHHGSDSSSTSGFLDCVRPQYAVISGSDFPNYYRPSPKVLERLKERGIQLYTTCHGGAIHATWSPVDWRITSFLSYAGNK